jgi:hypothetical protein
MPPSEKQVRRRVTLDGVPLPCLHFPCIRSPWTVGLLLWLSAGQVWTGRRTVATASLDSTLRCVPPVLLGALHGRHLLAVAVAVVLLLLVPVLLQVDGAAVVGDTCL